MSVDLNIRAVKVRMAEKGLNGTQAAKLAQVSRQNLCTILKRGSCSIASARKLAFALDMTMDEIIAKED